jgi:hypothetical protein
MSETREYLLKHRILWSSATSGETATDPHTRLENNNNKKKVGDESQNYKRQRWRAKREDEGVVVQRVVEEMISVVGRMVMGKGEGAEALFSAKRHRAAKEAHFLMETTALAC